MATRSFAAHEGRAEGMGKRHWFVTKYCGYRRKNRTTTDARYRIDRVGDLGGWFLPMHTPDAHYAVINTLAAVSHPLPMRGLYITERICV